VKREDLEHLIRAAANVLGEQDVLVIGSQAILGSYNDSGLPTDVTLSIEADLGSFEDPDERKADRIHGALGELSPFHQSFGVYGDGIATASAVLPVGWQDRLVPLADSTGSGAVGWCLDIHDLCAAKVYAGATQGPALRRSRGRASLGRPCGTRNPSRLAARRSQARRNGRCAPAAVALAPHRSRSTALVEGSPRGAPAASRQGPAPESGFDEKPRRRGTPWTFALRLIRGAQPHWSTAFDASFHSRVSPKWYDRPAGVPVGRTDNGLTRASAVSS
jgi:hypothetical protein